MYKCDQALSHFRLWHCTCSMSTRASLIDSMKKGKAGCWQDGPGGKCQRAGVKARGGGTWQPSSTATGT